MTIRRSAFVVIAALLLFIGACVLTYIEQDKRWLGRFVLSLTLLAAITSAWDIFQNRLDTKNIERFKARSGDQTIDLGIGGDLERLADFAAEKIASDRLRLNAVLVFATALGAGVGSAPDDLFELVNYLGLEIEKFLKSHEIGPQ